MEFKGVRSKEDSTSSLEERTSSTIDNSLKEVYETEDPIESQSVENTQLITETGNENIDRSSVATSQAFQRFSQQVLDTSKLDYSDSSAKRRWRARGGFLPVQTEFELESEKTNETPLQKFHRLQNEVKQLLDELNHEKEEIGKHSQQEEKQSLPQKISPIQLIEEVRQLQDQIQGLLRDTSLRPLLNPKYEMEKAANLQESLSKKLFGELESFDINASSSSSIATTLPQGRQLSSNEKSMNANVPDRTATYELYYRADIKSLSPLSTVAALENRLAHLEQTIGRSDIPSNTSLLEMVEQLKEKINLLTNLSYLEALQRKLQVTIHDMDILLTKSKDVPSKTTGEQKIDKIFETINKWENIAQQLPTLISRLQVLRTLHEEAGSFLETIQQLETQQEEIQKMLKNNDQVMSQMKSGFSENMTTIKSNIAVLEKRFSEIGKKMDQLQNRETY